jgi:hypothetical protein
LLGELAQALDAAAGLEPSRIPWLARMLGNQLANELEAEREPERDPAPDPEPAASDREPIERAVLHAVTAKQYRRRDSST